MASFVSGPLSNILQKHSLAATVRMFREGVRPPSRDSHVVDARTHFEIIVYEKFPRIA